MIDMDRIERLERTVEILALFFKYVDDEIPPYEYSSFPKSLRDELDYLIREDTKIYSRE